MCSVPFTDWVSARSLSRYESLSEIATQTEIPDEVKKEKNHDHMP